MHFLELLFNYNFLALYARYKSNPDDIFPNQSSAYMATVWDVWLWPRFLP